MNEQEARAALMAMTRLVGSYALKALDVESDSRLIRHFLEQPEEFERIQEPERKRRRYRICGIERLLGVVAL
jgi:hypothetical protein